MITRRRIITWFVLVGNFPVDESKTQPYHYQPDINSSNKDIERYEEIMGKLCSELDVGFLPIFQETFKADYLELLFDDGVHPNSKGHEFLATKIWNFMIDNHWV